MKRLHFKRDRKKDWQYWLMMSLLALAVIGITITTLQLIQFEDPKIYKYCNAISWLIIIFGNIKLIYDSMYVKWNDKKVILHINTWLRTTINFDEISSIERLQEKLVIHRVHQRPVHVDLTDVKETDRLLLQNVIQQETKSMDLIKAVIRSEAGV